MPLTLRALCVPLQSGNLVLAAPQFNFSQQAQYFNYTLLTPNVVDLAAYQAALAQLVQITQGLVTGQPPWQASGSPCNQPIPALQKCACAPLPQQFAIPEQPQGCQPFACLAAHDKIRRQCLCRALNVLSEAVRKANCPSVSAANPTAARQLQACLHG
jgi:hypothetical protein